MSSITSAYSSIPSPSSVDTEERGGSSVPALQLSVVGDREKDLPRSAPSSPKVKRSLHRRRRSQSLDGITMDSSSRSNFLSSQASLKIGSPTSEEEKEISPGYNTGTSDSECDSDDDGLGVEVGTHKMIPNLQEHRPLSVGLVPPGPHGPKESEEESEGGMGRLSQLKGKFLSKVMGSKNSSLPRPRSHSPQPKGQGSPQSGTMKDLAPSQTVSLLSTTPDEDGSGTNETLSINDGGSHDGDGDEGGSGHGRTTGGSQLLGMMKQRFRVNSPNLWRKMRKVSPSAQTPPMAEDLDLAKLEEARKKCRSRIIFI